MGMSGSHPVRIPALMHISFAVKVARYTLSVLDMEKMHRQELRAV